MEANMNILEGAQYRLRVKLTNEAGEQLPPENFRVYGGAFCPGYAPAHFHAERTAEEWVLTMPGLKPGRVPWNWQVIAAEYATGVEWLLAAGEVTVTPRHATGSAAIDPGELNVLATLDKTTLKMTVQLGESTAACSLAVVDARNSAAEANAAANSSARSAELSDSYMSGALDAKADAEGAADLAGESATKAGGHAAAAADSAAAAATEAENARAAAGVADGHAVAAAASQQAAGERAADAAVSSKAAADAASTAMAAAETATQQAASAESSAVAAAGSETAAAGSATAAARSAQTADASAELASERATEAAGCAIDAQKAQQDAENSAASAASTLNASAKKAENNTFTGTNTFNGVIAANGGITGLPGPASATAALHQQGGALLAFTQLANTLQCSLSWTNTGTTGTVVAGGSVESAAIDVFAAGAANVSYSRWGKYITYTALYMPFTIVNISDGGALHIALPFGTGNYGARTMTVIGQPVMKYEKIPASNTLVNRHAHSVELIISRSGSTYSAIVRGWKTAGNSLTGMREARFNLINTMVPNVNFRGITGVLMVRTSETTAAIFLRSTYLSSLKWHAVGEVNVYSSIFADYMAPLQVGVQGAKVSYMDSVYILAGAPCADAAKVLRAETVTTTVTDKTFDDYKTEYPA